jgi:hypothetical protein
VVLFAGIVLPVQLGGFDEHWQPPVQLLFAICHVPKKLGGSLFVSPSTTAVHSQVPHCDVEPPVGVVPVGVVPVGVNPDGVSPSEGLT